MSATDPIPAVSPAGFDVGDQRLPTSQPIISPECRERAALMVMDMILWRTPEEVAGGPSAEARKQFSDPLMRDEALTHVDMLIAALLGGRA